ncbi:MULTISPECIES: TetR/AcrR family transcriptional regulator [Microbulbifer]|uniref:TetR/AcrR family transcriptional regulator n=1 Tax=Microbulbifer TaxID=48073 RepID=UPI001E5F7771|nr:TetR/AcrR family transcriptional regulator [Microbulbifer sp. YPW16]UHQ55402.1 TetR/AcrR family transcriptional regulator [Microbulbifer sp. YPW16]
MSKVDKDTIIRAAEEVIREKGARKLTLDAVAAQCGLSKGGLLHHFRTKQALLKAMIESTIAREEAIRLGCGAPGGEGPGSELATRVQCMFALMADDEGLPRSLIAAVAEDPSLLEPIKAEETYLRQEVCKRSSDPELAQLLVFAARGIFLGRVLGVLEPGDPGIERLRERLVAMCKELD